MSSTTMTIRLDETMKARLEKLAQATHRSRSYLAVEAIRNYLELQEWQIQEIQQGIDDANAGRLIPHEEVKKQWEAKYADSVEPKGKE